MQPTITLAMIVCNEGEKLAGCLESLKAAVDEIVIVDTGSTDQTLAIAASYTNKIYHFNWTGDFSAARNFAIGKSNGKWVLSMDADEFLDGSQGTLRECIHAAEAAEAIFLPLRYLRHDSDMQGYDQFLVLRLFRNLPQYRFAGSIHEQLIIPCAGKTGIAEQPVIWHQAIPLKERNRKRNRNICLLNKACKHEPANYFLQHYLGVEWLGFGKFAVASTLFAAVCDNLPAEQVLFRAPAVCNLILCLRQEGRLAEAYAVCNKACQQYPVYTDLFFDAGTLLAEQGQYQQAVSWFQAAVAMGKPPPEFVHTNGVESFLAYDHLGHCHEAMGESDKAESYYRQAFRANPAYLDCLQHLFFLKLGQMEPARLFVYFRELGCLEQRRPAQALAELLLAAGFPEWAAACYAALPDWDSLAVAMRSMVFCGEFQQAINIINNARRQPEPLPAAAEIYEILAVVLNQEYPQARRLALTMWRDPAKRSTALAFLILLSKYTLPVRTIKPEKHREPAVIQTLLMLLDGCLGYRSRDRAEIHQLQAGYVDLANKTILCLTEMSAAGNAALAEYLKRKGHTVYKALAARLKLRVTAGGGLQHDK